MATPDRELKIEPKLESFTYVMGGLTFIVVLAMLLVVGTYAVQFPGWLASQEPQHWAQFGDYVGGVLNPLIAFFALIGLFVTLLQNRIQTADNARNLELARQQSRRAQEEFDAESRQQRFFKLVEWTRATGIDIQTNGELTSLVEHVLSLIKTCPSEQEFADRSISQFESHSGSWRNYFTMVLLCAESVAGLGKAATDTSREARLLAALLDPQARLLLHAIVHSNLPERNAAMAAVKLLDPDIDPGFRPIIQQHLPWWPKNW